MTGWHDALAAKSAEMGKTSAEFRAGARRKAMAALLYLAVTWAVGLFVSWSWALLPAALVAWSGFQVMSANKIADRLAVTEAQARPASEPTLVGPEREQPTAN